MTTGPTSDRPTPDPHADAPLRRAGPPIESAAGVLVLLHGRGATAESILGLHEALAIRSLAAIAPQASDNTWYPLSFLAPLDSNQPHLDSALARVESIVRDVLAAGVPSERIALLGFSQGACLACESAARHPRHYGALIALTGGLIGPDGTARRYPGSLDGTPVFLASGDPDAHVPFARVRETADVLVRMGAKVELRRYPGMPHTINNEELAAARDSLQRMVKDGAAGPSGARP
ncbi:MAG TPA: dienelactone hydrolase family protein [Phycisphaerales bacterium]|nr:dienelactone hydrolase family protein [Phycisphaerales bacterium]